MGTCLASGARRLGRELAALRRTASAAVRRPGPERDTVVQSCKAAGAAIAAWALTGWWLKAPLALLAPWTALTLVETTVYRSFRSGLQQLAVIMAGAVWASFAMAATGGSTLGAMLIALPAMVLFGTYRRFGAQGLYGATTSLFVIAYGSYSPSAVGHRLLETLTGAVIGIGVNACVLPPVHLRNVREQLARLPRDSAALLRTMAEALRTRWTASDAESWHDQARRLARIPAAVSEARRWTMESSRLNPGTRLRRTGPEPPGPDHDLRWRSVTGHLVTITRALDGLSDEDARLNAPGSAFLTRYAELADQMADFCDEEAHALESGSAPCSPRGEEPRRTAEEAWRLYDRLATDFTEQSGVPVAVSGELLVESSQLLRALTSYDTAVRESEAA
ncbi:FUSC family protein [Streptomyces sulfonofaciens]|uniref:FUSC family protein n=1 Tax=Streptomyces sulfonofaciens TaxID=68272 RepID=A0A919GMF3_9ACTN|nr:FUSC family protein [Streptomyces sulfonofaciens]